MIDCQLLALENQQVPFSLLGDNAERITGGGGRLGNIATQVAAGPGTGKTRALLDSIPGSITTERATSFDPETPWLAGEWLARGRAHGRRTRELSWRVRRPELFRPYVGEWVALEGEEVIAHAPELDRVIADARVRGVRVPYVFRVERPTDDIIELGL